MKTILFAVCLLLSIYCVANFTGSNTQQSTTVKKVNVPKIDYELDLTERCKDWIFFRDKAYRLVREGDNEGAVEAGKMKRQYYEDLKVHFTPDEISNELFRLEQERMAQN